jgi:hypothetical protein
MRIKHLHYLICCTMTFLHLGAQERPGYFGRKNIISVGSNIYYGDLSGRDASSSSIQGYRKGLPLQLSVETLVGKSRLIGLSLSGQSFQLYDNPLLYDQSSKYPLDVNGQRIMVDYGNGDINIREATAFVYIKKYLKYWKLPPYGFYSCWRAGISNYNITLSDDYSFRKNFDGLNVRDYIVGNNRVANFKQFYLGMELGKSTRITDRLLLSSSFLIHAPISFWKYGNTLTDRFNEQAKNYINEYKTIQFNLGLSYVL